MSDNRLGADLDHVLAHTRELWEELRGQRLFITGGTGFFGCWLVESFLWANDKLGLEAELHVLTRNAENFRHKVPHLANHPALYLHVGDVRDFPFPKGTFGYVIHAATEASAKLNEEDGLRMVDTIVQGTRRTLEFALQAGANRFLLTSSGAVYGPQPPETTHVPETYTGAPDPLSPGSAYGEGKRLSELLCALYQKQHGLHSVIARCFAFVGPYLPLDVHFAIGNFIRDGLAEESIAIGGDGTPYRSYLYAADLAIWLWTLLIAGAPGRAYNVGSEEDVTIAELARTVARTFPVPPEVRIAHAPVPGRPASRYVPSTRRIQQELGLKPTISLEEAIRRTAAWHQPALTTR